MALNLEKKANKNSMETFNKKENLRYERKFTTQNISKSAILLMIKNHPAFFKEIFHPRQINNIYLDTRGLKYYKNNVIGISKRKKVRIRWYGDTFGELHKPKLEYKLKSGLLGDKWTFLLNDFEFNSGFSKILLFESLKKSGLDEVIMEDLKTLEPSLLNTYQRTYFLSADKKFRLTLDEKMSYYFIQNTNNQFLTKEVQSEACILELKYLPEHDNEAKTISNAIPYRLDKSSKYVNGIDLMKIRQR